ncbi:hypothetical protein STAL104432_04990 [Streptomyces albus]
MSRLTGTLRDVLRSRPRSTLRDRLRGGLRATLHGRLRDRTRGRLRDRIGAEDRVHQGGEHGGLRVAVRVGHREAGRQDGAARQAEFLHQAARQQRLVGVAVQQHVHRRQVARHLVLGHRAGDAGVEDEHALVGHDHVHRHVVPVGEQLRCEVHGGVVVAGRRHVQGPGLHLGAARPFQLACQQLRALLGRRRHVEVHHALFVELLLVRVLARGVEHAESGGGEIVRCEDVVRLALGPVRDQLGVRPHPVGQVGADLRGPLRGGDALVRVLRQSGVVQRGQPRVQGQRQALALGGLRGAHAVRVEDVVDRSVRAGVAGHRVLAGLPYRLEAHQRVQGLLPPERFPLGVRQVPGRPRRGQRRRLREPLRVGGEVQYRLLHLRPVQLVLQPLHLVPVLLLGGDTVRATGRRRDAPPGRVPQHPEVGHLAGARVQQTTCGQVGADLLRQRPAGLCLGLPADVVLAAGAAHLPVQPGQLLVEGLTHVLGGTYRVAQRALKVSQLATAYRDQVRVPRVPRRVQLGPLVPDQPSQRVRLQPLPHLQVLRRHLLAGPPVAGRVGHRDQIPDLPAPVDGHLRRRLVGRRRRHVALHRGEGMLGGLQLLVPLVRLPLGRRPAGAGRRVLLVPLRQLVRRPLRLGVIGSQPLVGVPQPGPLHQLFAQPPGDALVPLVQRLSGHLGPLRPAQQVVQLLVDPLHADVGRFPLHRVLADLVVERVDVLPGGGDHLGVGAVVDQPVLPRQPLRHHRVQRFVVDERRREGLGPLVPGVHPPTDAPVQQARELLHRVLADRPPHLLHRGGQFDQQLRLVGLDSPHLVDGLAHVLVGPAVTDAEHRHVVAGEAVAGRGARVEGGVPTERQRRLHTGGALFELVAVRHVTVGVLREGARGADHLQAGSLGELPVHHHVRVRGSHGTAVVDPRQLVAILAQGGPPLQPQRAGAEQPAQLGLGLGARARQGRVVPAVQQRVPGRPVAHVAPPLRGDPQAGSAAGHTCPRRPGPGPGLGRGLRRDGGDDVGVGGAGEDEAGRVPGEARRGRVPPGLLRLPDLFHGQSRGHGDGVCGAGICHEGGEGPRRGVADEVTERDCLRVAEGRRDEGRRGCRGRVVGGGVSGTRRDRVAALGRRLLAVPVERAVQHGLGVLLPLETARAVEQGDLLVLEQPHQRVVLGRGPPLAGADRDDDGLLLRPPPHRHPGAVRPGGLRDVGSRAGGDPRADGVGGGVRIYDGQHQQVRVQLAELAGGLPHPDLGAVVPGVDQLQLDRYVELPVARHAQGRIAGHLVGRGDALRVGRGRRHTGGDQDVVTLGVARGVVLLGADDPDEGHRQLLRPGDAPGPRLLLGEDQFLFHVDVVVGAPVPRLSPVEAHPHGAAERPEVEVPVDELVVVVPGRQPLRCAELVVQAPDDVRVAQQKGELVPQPAQVADAAGRQHLGQLPGREGPLEGGQHLAGVECPLDRRQDRRRQQWPDGRQRFRPVQAVAGQSQGRGRREVSQGRRLRLDEDAADRLVLLGERLVGLDPDGDDIGGAVVLGERLPSAPGLADLEGEGEPLRRPPALHPLPRRPGGARDDRCRQRVRRAPVDAAPAGQPERGLPAALAADAAAHGDAAPVAGLTVQTAVHDVPDVVPLLESGDVHLGLAAEEPSRDLDPHRGPLSGGHGGQVRLQLPRME